MNLKWSKCKCKKTNTVGYYTTHSTSHHKNPRGKNEVVKETTESASANLSPTITTEKKSPTEMDPDPDGLEFERR